MLVVDASAIIGWALREPAVAERMEAVVARVLRDGATAPAVWPFEVANTLVMAVRRQRLTQDEARAALAQAATLAVALDATSLTLAWERAAPLAFRHALTAYDATYLELALRHHAVLASLDAKLVAAARAEGLDCLD